MQLSPYLTKRVLHVFSTLCGTALFIHILFNIAGGDPAIMMGGKYASAERLQEIRHTLGLDKSWLLQYWEVLKSFFTFEFGRSWSTHHRVIDLVRQGGIVSLQLTLPSFLVSNVLSTTLALIAAFFRGKNIDRSIVVGSVALMSISVVSYILLGQYLFAYKLGWFPINGYQAGFPSLIYYLLLPWIILVVLSIGPEIRLYRTVILEEISQDYVRTARAKGLSYPVVLFKHVLRNAMIPILTNVIIQLPGLLLGSLLLENFFSIPGIGGIIANAINTSDFPVIKAVTIVLSAFYILCTLLADLLYVLIDPRLKIEN